MWTSSPVWATKQSHCPVRSTRKRIQSPMQSSSYPQMLNHFPVRPEPPKILFNSFFGKHSVSFFGFTISPMTILGITYDIGHSMGITSQMAGSPRKIIEWSSVNEVTLDLPFTVHSPQQLSDSHADCWSLQRKTLTSMSSCHDLEATSWRLPHASSDTTSTHPWFYAYWADLTKPQHHLFAGLLMIIAC